MRSSSFQNEQQTGMDSQSVPFVEMVYAQYLRDPASVGADWRQYFENLNAGGNGQPVLPAWPKEAPHFERTSLFHRRVAQADGKHAADLNLAVLQERVDQLIRNYRVRGHIIADLDPLGQPRPHPPELAPAYYGFRESDYDRTFAMATADGQELLTFREILDRLQNTYCRRIGVQFMHIDDLEVRQWLQYRMERTQNRLELSRDEQLHILSG